MTPVARSAASSSSEVLICYGLRAAVTIMSGAEACSICSNLTTAARWTMGIVSTEIRILHKIYY